MNEIGIVFLAIIYLIGLAISFRNTRHALRLKHSDSMTLMVMDLFRAKGAGRYILVVALILLWPIYVAIVSLFLVIYVLTAAVMTAPGELVGVLVRIREYVKNFSSDIADLDR